MSLTIGRRRNAVRFILFVLLHSSAACSDPTSPGSDLTREEFGLSITPGSPTIEVGARIKLRGIQGGKAYAEPVTWTIANSSVATIDALGTLTGRYPGETTVTASNGRLSASAKLKVDRPSAAHRIHVDPDSASLMVGEQVTLSGDVRMGNGRVIATVGSWSSADASIATVSASGVVQAVNAGETTIIASWDNLQATVPIRVHEDAGAIALRLEVDPTAQTLQVGDTTTFAGLVRDDSGDVLSTAVQWSSEDETITTVDEHGHVKALRAGSTRVLARWNDIEAASTVTVEAVEESPTAPVTGGQLPELPRVYVDRRYPATSGNVIRVAAGGDVQAALNAARAGDVVELQAGAVYEGAFKLPVRSDGGYVIIRSSRAGELPAGVRVSLADTVRMARLLGGQSNFRTLSAAPGAGGYWIEGIEILAMPDERLPGVLNALVEFELGSQRIIMDRVIVRGRTTTNVQRCIIMNGAHIAVTNSWLGECHADGFDSQAIVGWRGPGPYHIENNYLGGAGENIMFGGASMGDDGQLPSDIVIRRNHIHKPLSWQGVWTVKNLLELKFGQRFLIEGNVLENVWADAQVGFAVNLKSENRDIARGRMDVATTDVTFRNNRIVNARFGITIIPKGSTDAVSGDGITSRVLMQNNDLGVLEGRAFQLGSVIDVNLDHNTVHGGINLEGTLVRFVFTNNLVFGDVKGSGVRAGEPAFTERAPGAIVSGNVIVSEYANTYPGDTLVLSPSDSYSGSAGVDDFALEAATAGVVR